MPSFTAKISIVEAARVLKCNTVTELSGLYITVWSYTSEGGSVSSNVPARSADIAPLIPLIFANTSLHSIDFSFNELSIHAPELLMALAQRKTPFKAISFSYTNLFKARFNNYDTFRSFFRTICCEELYLRSCEITAGIMDEIIDAIALNPWLKKLDVSRNKLKNKGVIRVTETLISPNLSNIGTIQLLKLSYNGHRNEAAIFIQKAMEKNYAIKRLSIAHIAGNPIKHYQIHKAISQLIKRNLAIAKFYLAGQDKPTSFPVAGFYLLAFSQYFLQDRQLKRFPSALTSLVLSYLDNIGKFKFLTEEQKGAIFSYAIHHEPDLVLDPAEFMNHFQRYLFFEETRNVRQLKAQLTSEGDMQKSSDVSEEIEKEVTLHHKKEEESNIVKSPVSARNGYAKIE